MATQLMINIDPLVLSLSVLALGGLAVMGLILYLITRK